MGQIIDVSKWQGSINWKEVAKDDVDFVILRASCGTAKDEKFEEYARGCQQNGIPFGVYHYSMATSNTVALSEIKTFYNTAKPYAPKFWALDIEDASQLYANGKSLPMRGNFKSLVTYLHTELRKRVGSTGKIVFYGGSSVYEPYGGLSSIPWDAVWFANYSAKSTPYATVNGAKIYCDLWQYSSKGRVNGIGTNVDQNRITDKSSRPLSWWIGAEQVQNELEPVISGADLNSDGKVVRITEPTAWNIRDYPDTKTSAVVGIAKVGEEYDWIATSFDGWFMIKGEGVCGWVSSKAGRVEDVNKRGGR